MEPAPLFDDVASAPAGGRAFWLRAADGLKLRIGVWTPDAARGTLLLFPGRTEYIEKYGPAVGEFARQGLATLVVDWRGQGLSDRMLGDRLGGHVMQFSDYQLDVAALTAAARELSLPRPFHLLAHSMGGTIGLRALLDGLDVERAVFSSPMWGISIAPTLRPVAWTLSWLARQARLDHHYAPGTSGGPYPGTVAFDANLLTSDPDQFAWMASQVERHPDLALGGPSLRWLNEALMACRTMSVIPSPPVPCLTLVGSDEKIVDIESITDRMRSWPGGQLVTIEGARHESLMETPERRARAFDAIEAHLATDPG